MAAREVMPPRPWAIKAKWLFDGSPKPPVQDAVVVIEGTQVSAAGPASQVRVPPGADVMDVGSRTVMPGLVDAHVHMLFTGGPASIRESRSMSEGEALLVGVRNALLALTSGLTTVRDCGDINYVSLTLRDAINCGRIPGPRIACSGPPITTTGGQLWWTGIECNTEEELRQAVRTLVKKGVDFIKLMGSGGNATPGSNPEAAQYDAAGFKAVVDDAHRLGKKVAAHVHGLEAIRLAVDAGVDTLEHCPFRAGGTISYDPKVVDEITRKGIAVSLAMPATWYRMTAAEMGDDRTHPGHLWEARYETIRRMHAAGVRLVVSSDQGSSGTLIDELPLLIEFLVKAVNIPARDVLHGATGLAAEALGMSDQVGTLTPGRVADILVVEGNPLADISAMRHVYAVVKSGDLVVRDGGLLWPPASAAAPLT